MSHLSPNYLPGISKKLTLEWHLSFPLSYPYVPVSYPHTLQDLNTVEPLCPPFIPTSLCEQGILREAGRHIDPCLSLRPRAAYQSSYRAVVKLSLLWGVAAVVPAAQAGGLRQLLTLGLLSCYYYKYFGSLPHYERSQNTSF